MHAKKDLAIVADTQISYQLEDLQYPEQMKKNLNIRILELHKKLDNKFDEVNEINFHLHFISTGVFNEMVNGKTVLLTFTKAVRGYQDQYSRWSKWFTVSEIKYLNSFNIFLVYKRHTQNQFIKFM